MAVAQPLSHIARLNNPSDRRDTKCRAALTEPARKKKFLKNILHAVSFSSALLCKLHVTTLNVIALASIVVCKIPFHSPYLQAGFFFNKHFFANWHYWIYIKDVFFLLSLRIQSDWTLQEVTLLTNPFRIKSTIFVFLKFCAFKHEIFLSFAAACGPMGVKLSKRYSSYKALPNY